MIRSTAHIPSPRKTRGRLVLTKLDGRKYAESVAFFLNRITGEPTEVIYGKEIDRKTGYSRFKGNEVRRWTGSKWVRG